MKRLVFLVTVLIFMATTLLAQPPKPPTGMGSGDNTQDKTSMNRDEDVPVGTATLLMLGLGGAFLGYKVKSNRKQKNGVE